MKVEFCGVRGSVPRPLSPSELCDRLCELSKDGVLTEAQIKRAAKSGKLSYGSNTSCVQLSSENTSLIIDAGTGLRGLGGRYAASSEPVHLLLTHLHWDHIHGMPFFAPFYIPGKEVHIHSPVESEALEQCLRDQWRHPYFPITFDQLLGKIHFHHFKRSTQIGDFNIKAVDLVHPNPTYGFRVEQGGTSYVHFSDVELRELSKAKLKQYRAIMKDADFVVGDTQFDLDEIETFKTWGHSCAETFLELFGDCGIKTFAMFHYNPQESEAKIDQLLRSAKKKAKTTPSQTKVIPAIEGQVIQL